MRWQRASARARRVRRFAGGAVGAWLFGQPCLLHAEPAVDDGAGSDSGGVLADVSPSSTPQWHVGLASGLGILRRPDASALLWENTLSSHVLFGRTRDSDIGVGPYARVGYLWREAVACSAGASVLLPLNATFPAILSLGGVAAWRGAKAEPGLEAWLFVGPSSYNFHSSYSMASGLLLGAQRTWGTTNSTTFVVALQVDMAWLALPVIALIEVVRGPSRR